MGYAGIYTGKYSGALAGRSTLRSPLSTYLFDTGLGKPQRLIVLDAVVELLSRLHRLNGGYLEAIETSSSLVDERRDDNDMIDILDQLGGRVPGVLVSCGDREFDPAGATSQWQGPVEVHVYFMTNSMRDRMTRVGGDVEALATPTADPGVFVMMEHALQLLAGQKPGGNAAQSIKELRPTREHRVGTDGDHELWRQVYSVQLVNSVNHKRDIDLDLKLIAAYHRTADQASSDAPILTTETDIP